MKTVAALHKELGDLIARGHGRKPVCVNKRSFHHPLEEDGVVVIEVKSITEPRWVGTSDDDGGTKWNKDGSEAGRYVVLLEGDHKE